MRLKKIWLHFLSHFFPTLIGYQRVKWFSADGGGVIYIRVCRSFAAFSPLLVVVVVHLLTVMMITYQRITLDAHTLYRAISFFLFLSIGRFWCCSLASTGHFRALTLLVMSSNWHFCFAQQSSPASAIKELRWCSRHVVYLFRAVTTGVLGCLHFSFWSTVSLSTFADTISHLHFAHELFWRWTLWYVRCVWHYTEGTTLLSSSRTLTGSNWSSSSSSSR